MEEHMNLLPGDMCNTSDLLEHKWIDRISELEQRGKSYGDFEYDEAIKNLCAVVNEFWICDED